MTEAKRTGTSGGGAGTNSLSPRALTALLLGALVAYGLVRITSNVFSYLADRRAAGSDVTLAHAWIYESTSLAAWLLMMIPCWYAVRAIRPPRLSWPAAAAIFALLSVPLSLGHVALMVGLRILVLRLLGDDYIFTSPDGSPLLYEYRKDVASYVEIILVFFLIQWLVARYAATLPAPPAPATLAVGDGSTTHHIPVAEIETVTAAANYVEIVWRGRTLLHRATLSGIEGELAGAGFVRIHRSRLVRKHAVRRVVTLKSGDFDVEMESGATLRGSRRYRPELEG